MLAHTRAPLIVLVLLVASAACDLLESVAVDDEGGKAIVAPDVEPEAEGDPTLLAQPLVQSKKRTRFIGKGAEHPGWKMTSLATMYSLAGGPEVPDWSAEGEGSARGTRDDDLLTAWTCPQTKEKSCAIGIHFPTPAAVVALRVHLSPRISDDPSAYARIKTLRVHTDEGWAEGSFESDFEEHYLILGEPVTTRSLSVEVIELHSGPSRVRFAELDVFGREGVARDPLDVDPSTMFIRIPEAGWKKVGGERELAYPRLEYLAPDGSAHVLCAGSAVYGLPGDRFLLVEKLFKTKCKSHLGAYVLLDLQSHVQVPLGDLGGIPGQVFRHKEAMGFVAGYVAEDETRVHGSIWDGGQYQRKKSPRATRDTYHELFAEWGVSETEAHRGGATLDDPPEGCAAGSAEEFELLMAARAAGAPAAIDDPDEEAPGADNKGKKKAKQKPAKKGVTGKLGGPADRWMVCTVGASAKLFVSSGEACGKSWEIAVVNGGGKLSATLSNSVKGAHLRVRRRSADELFVEAAAQGDAVETFRVQADAITSLGVGTALALGPPEACKKACNDPFVNPRAP